MPKTHKIILFDGICNLCNRAVRFVIRHDKEGLFRFASIQSEAGQVLIRARNIDTEKTDSIILIEPGIAYYTKSDAALEIGKAFGGAWKLLGMFGWIPSGFRNAIYDLVARNRYKWFGERESCMLPTEELKSKFL